MAAEAVAAKDRNATPTSATIAARSVRPAIRRPPTPTEPKRSLRSECTQAGERVKTGICALPAPLPPVVAARCHRPQPAQVGHPPALAGARAGRATRGHLRLAGNLRPGGV